MVNSVKQQDRHNEGPRPPVNYDLELMLKLMQRVKIPKSREEEECVFSFLIDLGGVWLDRIQVVKKLGLSMDSRSKSGTSILEWGIRKGDQEGVEALLDCGADASRECEQGLTPLFSAIFYNRTIIMRILIDAGADVNYRHKFNTVPLSYAIMEKNANAMACLINHGAEIGGGDIRSIFDILFRGYPTKEGMGECEYSADKFKKYLKRAREEELFDVIEEYCCDWFPRSLSKELSEWAGGEMSGKGFVQIAARGLSHTEK